MEIIKKIKSHEGQFFSYVMDFQAGDVDHNDSLVGEGVTSVPLNARLSIDSEETLRLHTENINKYKDNNIVWSPQLQMFSRPKDATDWGLFPEQQRDWKISEFFDTDGNDIIIPMNRRISDLRARLGNTKLLDSDGYVENYAHHQRPSRPSSITYKNNCRVVCVTFVPNVDIEWKNGAWLQFEYNGPIKLRKKGSSLNYFVTAKDTELMDGTRIVAGVAYRMDSGELQLKADTNIILHIHD
ncbi:hypothetical protein N9J19_00245 [bacterium]|nr:hypothetical protein [bacterium]